MNQQNKNLGAFVALHVNPVSLRIFFSPEIKGVPFGNFIIIYVILCIIRKNDLIFFFF
ncbi:hypothetical protein H8356DRAFT_1696432 [Neocallimastix lanati (nom. inval.)]|nr:hypothetical protein H8356DRAFT_1696432 [Neocallimastix sp. JGI-2020a]